MPLAMTQALLATTRVPAPIRQALEAPARRGTAPFAELLETARRESGFKTDAKNPNSSATGLFQFTEQTWLEMVRRHGAKYGIGEEAAKIVRDPATGRNEVPSAEDRSAILALRKDAKLAAEMAGELTKTNRTSLQRALGREPTYQEVYAAHFLGANGAVRLIRAAEENPDMPANRLLPQAARANKAVFRDSTERRYRTVGELADRLEVAQTASVEPRGPISGATFTEGISRRLHATHALSAQLTAQLAANEG
jgi:hypothetical protein